MSKGIRQSRWIAAVAAWLAVGLLVVSAAPAWAQYRQPTFTPVDIAQAVEGEVRSFRAVEGVTYMVLVEWPVTIRLTEQTQFVTLDGTLLTVHGVSALLPGRAVRVYPRLSQAGDYVADKIEVLPTADLTRLRAVRPERMAPSPTPQKDQMPRRRR